MSLKAKLTKRKLNPSLLRNKSFDGKGGTWADHDKSLSLPNIANTSPSKPAYPDSSRNGYLQNGLNSHGNNAGKAKAFILRKLKFRSLTESRNLTKSDSSTSKENAYDKCPGSNSTNKKDGGDTPLEDSSPQNCAPQNALQSHQFSHSPIGYLNAPKRGDKSKSVENISSCCEDNDTLCSNHHDEGNYVKEPGISSDSTACYESAEGFTNPTDVTLGQVCGNSNDRDHSSLLTEQFPEDRPPARPPKPIELRGEPLTSKPLEEDGNVPPKPPARLPTGSISRTFPSIRAVKLLHGNRESGAYESIDDKDHSCLVAEQNLPGELRKLPQQPWYWGPLTQEQAEGKLRGLPNGYFLVRDSSDERYLLSLSFNSNGRPVHTRFEYVGGLFSINDSQGYVSVVDLIEDAVRESQNGIYSFMQNINGTQTFPARLTNPVSRFTEMKSLQHLCRFVIRETFPRHYIADLPVPEKIRKYILENQY